MNDTAHYAEHSVTKKYEGSYGRRRVLAIILFVICPIAVLTLMLAAIGAGAFIWFVPLSPTAILIAKGFIYDRFFGTEYTYIIAGGTLTVTEHHHNGRYKRELISFRISSAELILPLRENRDKISAIRSERRIEAVASMSGEDVYAIAVTDNSGKRCLVFIDGIQKAVRLLNLYNRSAVVRETRY